MRMRFDADTIAQAILTAPGWARVGITAPSEHLREDATHELATVILADIEEADHTLNADQLKLSI